MPFYPEKWLVKLEVETVIHTKIKVTFFFFLTMTDSSFTRSQKLQNVVT